MSETKPISEHQSRDHPIAVCYRAQDAITFQEIKTRLLDHLNRKVRGGEISERQLARLTGYSQPYIHQVLKGQRGVNARLADAVLRGLHMSLGDLIQDHEPAGTGVLVPLWRGHVGPCHPFPETGEAFEWRPLPASVRVKAADPVLLRLSTDEDSMPPVVQPGDTVLVDRAVASRRFPDFQGVYIVSVGNHGRACRCQIVGGALVLVADNPCCSFRLPDRISLKQRDVLDIVQGRIVWSCRDLNP